MAEDLTPGQMLADRFEIISLVGRGGMASVYEARDTVLGRVVAIKVFAVDTSDDRARLESEVQLLSGLNHPHLVTVHDARISADPADGPSFLVMEFVTGQTLREANSGSPLTATAIATVASNIAEALSVVHQAGIVHRDVKPANILLEPGAAGGTGVRAKLADFGIAHTMGSTRLTATGMVIGTAGYLSPEQAEGRDVTSASDIYALGLVLLESLKGQAEYPGGVAESLAARLARDPAIPESLSAEWSSLLGEMLARDPASRPTAAAVARRSALIAAAGPEGDAGTQDAPTMLLPTELAPTELAPAARTADIPTRVLTAAATAPPKARRRHPVRIGVIIAVIVALAVIAIVLTQTRFPSTVPAGPSPGASRSPTPIATTSVTPTVPAPVKTKGNGKGPGKGPGKGHGPGKHP